MRRFGVEVGVFLLLAAVQSTAGTTPIPRAGETLRRPARPIPATGSPTAGFQDRIVISGLNVPTVVQFSRDSRIFIGEKSGVIMVYDGFNDPTPTVFADLSTNVHDYGDRGLLGLALDPAFPTNPYVYVLYTLDAPIGVQPPVYNDGCAEPFGDGCLVGARVSRLEAAGEVWTGVEDVLIEDWCQQYTSHSIGTLAFGPDGALYVGGGDGASFVFADYGQGGSPKNPCMDPGGRNPVPPTAEGGALRSQDLQTSGNVTDPAGMNGAILRIDPATGDALPDNPLFGGADLTDDRVIAYGMRNPFRFTVKPGTDQIWIGDVGWNTWEEIDKLADANDSVVEDFGWPCFEGIPHEPDYDVLDLSICENLYGGGGVAAPFWPYNHQEHVVEGEDCPVGSSAISGVAFYQKGTYPVAYRGALFFTDVIRSCIWVMFRGANGDPDPDTRAVFESSIPPATDLKIGPKGDLFYVDIYGGAIHRIRFTG
jgi:glucose/arabinose dehydrogenase